MAQTTPSHPLSLSGKVIDVIEQSGSPTARMSVDPFFFDGSAEGIHDAHLGDTVVIDASVTTKRIRHALDAQRDGFRTTTTKT
jgi:hypothetical protein